MFVVFQRFLVLIAFAMLSCAQVFGVLEGYLCGHDGSSAVTQVTHCHESGTVYVPCEEPPSGIVAEDCADLPGTEKHAQVASHLSVFASKSLVTAPASSLPLLLVLPSLEPCSFDGSRVATVLRSLHGGNEMPSNTARQVAGCVVLLV